MKTIIVLRLFGRRRLFDDDGMSVRSDGQMRAMADAEGGELSAAKDSVGKGSIALPLRLPQLSLAKSRKTPTI